MTLSLVLGRAAVLFAVVQGGAAWFATRVDLTVAWLAATAVFLAVALTLQRVLFGRGLELSLTALGFRRPAPAAIVVAVVLTLVMLAFFPVFAILTGASISLKADWWSLVIASVALNGIAEETLFRGYVFGELRRFGLTFLRAGVVSLGVFAAVHLYLFAQNHWAVALLATMVAIATAFPFAYLFERGGRAIWAPAIVHVGVHAIRFVEIPEPHYQTALFAWLAMQMAAPFLVFGFRRTLAKPGREPG